MQPASRSYLPFIVSAVLLGLVLYLIYPHYQYYIDADGTSYLTISQRYADGDIQTAINGLWSPWACWLTALLIKADLQAIPASIIVNALGATGFLWISDNLFARFAVQGKVRWVYCLTLVVFLCYAVFWQSFDDLWGCFFMLCVLRVMLLEGFVQKPLLWVSIGAIGALAFFAKAYSLPYFMLAVTVSVFFLVGSNKLQWFKIVCVATPVLLLCCFPWLYALHSKYGIWTTSTAGPLNMSWYLVGHPEWKEGIDVLLPPAYPTSVYYWEDPWYANGHLSHWWDSSHLAVRQVLKLGYNFLMLLWCMVEISFFLPLVGLLILWQIIKRFRTLTPDVLVMYLFFILLPAGYILVHLESRYLWIMLPIGMIVAHREIPNLKVPAVVKKYALYALSLSLVLFPLWGLKTMFHYGKEEYEFAQLLKMNGIQGTSFVSNLHARFLSKTMYFSGNRFYVISKQRPAENENKTANTNRLLRDIRRYNVLYYLYSPKGNGKVLSPGFDDMFYSNLADSTSPITYQKVLHDPASGLIIYKLQ